MTLRPYQAAACAEVQSRFDQGKRWVCVVGSVGSGKTVIGAELCRGRGRVLWVAHRAELLLQACQALYQAGVTGCDCVMIQSHYRPAVDFVVWDECHHTVSDKWSEFARAYRHLPAIGLTATPARADGRGLGNMFDDIVLSISTRDAIAQGYLAPCDIIAPPQPLRSRRLADTPVSAWKRHALGKKTVVFAPTVAAAEQMQLGFVVEGVTAELVHGGLSATARKEALSRFANGESLVMLNVSVLTEGYDDPGIECVILARSIGSPGLYIQCVGRALRTHPGKTRATVIDLYGSCHLHGAPDEDYEFSLDGEGIRTKEPCKYRFCQVCGALITGEACTDCGITIEQKPWKVDATPMVKFAAKRAETSQERVDTLARYIHQARVLGYKPGWAYFKYRAVYGVSPTREIIEGARKK